MFATDQRRRIIDDPAALHAYMAGVAEGLGATPYAIGGVDDHVHVLIGYPPKISISDFVRELKKASTSWMQARNRGFQWQTGYAVFAVNPESFEAVRDYVRNQAAHHEQVDSRTELLNLLREFGIEPNMQFFE